MRMKRIAIGLLSLAVIGIYAQPSWAWLFHHCGGCKYSTYICCRPYNAFTPVCFGNITGIGCCPIALGCCQPPPPPPNFCCGPAMCDPCCDGGSCCSGPGMVLPPNTGNFTPPPPTPLPSSVSLWQPPRYPVGQPYNVQQVSYYPGYYPPYNPAYWPTPAAPMPNYWYGR